MKRKSIALLLAAAMLAGTMYTASAEESTPPAPSEDEEFCEGWCPGRGPGGPRGGWGRHDRDRDDRRGGPGQRGPGARFHHDDSDGKGFGMGPGMGFGRRGWDKIQLDDAQKAKMVDVMTANYRARLEAKMNMMEAQRKLRDLRKDDSASHDAIVAANAAMGEARGKLEVLGRKSRDEMRSILTPEQVKTLDEMRDAPPPRPGDKRDGKRPGGPDDRRPPRPGPRG